MNTPKRKTAIHPTAGVRKPVSASVKKKKISPELKIETVAELGYSDHEIASLTLALEQAHGLHSKPPGYFHSEALERLLAARDFQKQPLGEVTTFARAAEKMRLALATEYIFAELPDSPLAEVYKDPTKSVPAALKRFLKNKVLQTEADRIRAETMLRNRKVNGSDIVLIRLALNREATIRAEGRR